MNKIINQIVKGAHLRDFSFDLYLPEGQSPINGWPLLVFAHGFKGFKDWGHWYKIAERFTHHGFAFLKFNFAFNGTTIEHPFDFSDLEAFGKNNFSKELADVQTILDWVGTAASEYALDMNAISLIGHSRGGPIVLLTAAADVRVKSVITWASVHELDYAWQSPTQLEKWKNEGVLFTVNGRTGQQMPMYYQLYEDFINNVAHYRIKNALKDFHKPMLIVQGDNDPAVKLSSAEYLKNIVPSAELVIIEGADHVFGAMHPFLPGNSMPTHSEQLINACLSFLGEGQTFS